MKIILKNIILASLVLFGTMLYAEQKCKVHPDVLDAIAKIEGHNKRDFGYPYIISFNKQSDMLKLKQDERWFAIDKRTIDCISLENCISVYDELIDLEILNVDLGAFQINPRFFVYQPNEYFTFEIAKQKVCEILMEINKKNGWSWESVARYHSSKKTHNEAYQSRLKQIAIQNKQTESQNNAPLKTYKFEIAINNEVTQ